MNQLPARFHIWLKAWSLLWFQLAISGLFLFFGLRYFLSGWPTGSDFLSATLAIVLIMFAASFLLTMEFPVSPPTDGEPADRDSTKSRVEAPQPTSWAHVAELLLFKKPSALALLVTGIFGVVVISYYVITSMFGVEFQGDSGTVVVKLPGHTAYYYPIDPYGWQDTGIPIRNGQTFRVKISGRVSIGHLRHNANREFYEDGESVDEKERLRGLRLRGLLQLTDPAKLRQFPFRGRDGYSDNDYKEQGRDALTETNNPRNTVRGLRRFAVVGVIVNRDEDACPSARSVVSGPQLASPKAPWKQPCIARKIDKKSKPGTDDYEPGYEYPDPTLYVLSDPANSSENDSNEARKSGNLWVTINDTDISRWDNAGLFILRLTTPR